MQLHVTWKDADVLLAPYREAEGWESLALLWGYEEGKVDKTWRIL